MYTITVMLPDSRSVSTELKGGRCVVGRLASRSDLVVPDPSVSGAHLVITEENEQLTIEDLGSSNGTWFDAEKLPPHAPRPLGPDQAVGLGSGCLLTVTSNRSWEMTRIEMPTYKPKYVGVLYSDIVSSTAMTARLGPEKATELLEWHNQMFRSRFKRFTGRETKFTGDGFEAVFNSVTDALSCAASCQRELARRNQQDKSGLRLEVRMGVNGGEAPTSGKRVFGMPLILAARVMALAEAGQILVPEHVTGVVSGSLFRFRPVGARQLKGLDEPFELLEFLWQQDPGLRAPDEVQVHADAPAGVANAGNGRKGTVPLH